MQNTFGLNVVPGVLTGFVKRKCIYFAAVKWNTGSLSVITCLSLIRGIVLFLGHAIARESASHEET